jgi:hypothetical protein
VSADQCARLRRAGIRRAQYHDDRGRERNGRQRIGCGVGKHFHALDGDGAASRAGEDGKQSNPVEHAVQAMLRRTRRNKDLSVIAK